MRSLLCLVLMAAIATTFSQTHEIQAVKLEAAPAIDGVIQDEEWAKASKVSGLFDEETGAPSAESGTFWIGYDENFIYFAAKLSDPSPGAIRAVEYRTNVSLDSDDHVGFGIDCSGSGSDFNVFKVNPKGATEIELAGGRAAKREWTGEFFAKSRITETGWEAEVRVPWQVLRLPSAAKRDLRINFLRRVARTNRSFLHVFVPDGSTTHPFWRNVEMPAPQVTRTLKLLPYTYFGWDPDTRHIVNAGLDLKTQLTDQVELVGTINPDFRNIENQILSLDFSRFERLAGESRPFFQEGRSYLDTALFASQRIDNFDVGVNTYGRLSNKTSFAFLDTADWDRVNIIGNARERGTRNNFVANITHDFDPKTSLRASVTSVNRPDLKNDAHLLRLSKTWGDFNLFARDMASKDSVAGYGRNQDIYLNYERNGFGAYGGYNTSTPQFLPRLAFIPETDYRGWDLGSFYNRPFDRGWLNDWGFSISLQSYERFNGAPYRHEYVINPFATLRNGLAIVPYARLGEFEGVIDKVYGLSLGFPRGNPYRNISLTGESGEVAGQDYRSLRAAASYRLFGKLQLNGSYQVVNHFTDLSQAILSANYDLGNDRSIAGRFVARDDDTNFYVALKQSGNLGAEYFLILGDPNARQFRPSLILKVTVPFEIPLSKSKKSRQPEPVKI